MSAPPRPKISPPPDFRIGTGLWKSPEHREADAAHHPCKPPKSLPWRRIYKGDRWLCSCGQWWERTSAWISPFWRYFCLGGSSACLVMMPVLIGVSVWYRVWWLLPFCVYGFAQSCYIGWKAWREP